MDAKKDANEVFELHAIVLGDVHGVGFRASTLHYAQQLGLSGNVKNLSNGSVEIEAQGHKDNLEKLLIFLKQRFGSNIQDMKTKYLPFNGVLKNFLIIN